MPKCTCNFKTPVTPLERNDNCPIHGARACCNSPSACSAPDFTEVLKRMKHIMQAHPWWKKRIDGTPLANDLPVRAAVECCEIIRELQNASLERLPEGGC